jgi:hypothetical protein
VGQGSVEPTEHRGRGTDVITPKKYEHTMELLVHNIAKLRAHALKIWIESGKPEGAFIDYEASVDDDGEPYDPICIYLGIIFNGDIDEAGLQESDTRTSETRLVTALSPTDTLH